MIYCVEDDDNIRELMVYTLQTTGFEAEGFSTSQPFWHAMEQQEPTLIILDVMLPGEDGISLLKQLKQQVRWEHIPVIMATAKGNEYDKVKGLDLGADDYLVKPFGMMEMVSRIKAVLRRIQRRDILRPLTMGELVMDLSAHKVKLSGERIELTFKEFELLRLFLSHPGQVFSRNDLLNKIWGEDFLGETRTVDVHIGTLRTKLGTAAEYIKTVRGVGYMMESTHD
ncbi:winged helix-turn-helix domain-containing protein [Atopobacter phocae]|uniref:winged helix-turn-helix domain-containing protein n=1 Tax=Atopobacter phocae TaxID=136492 RepID=UPI00046F9757|nr:response regulator transcription factor [Atopobacter phocae]